MPGLKIHPRQGPDEHFPLPFPQALSGAGEEGGDKKKERSGGGVWGVGGVWGERMTNRKETTEGGAAAAEGIKRNIERISQLGIVPAKIFSLLIKKIKLTS